MDVNILPNSYYYSFIPCVMSNSQCVSSGHTDNVWPVTTPIEISTINVVRVSNINPLWGVVEFALFWIVVVGISYLFVRELRNFVPKSKIKKGVKNKQ